MLGCRVTNSGNESLNTNMVTNKITPENAGLSVAGITFEKEVFNFGKISQGEKITFTFKFKSSGEGPLVIGAVKPSCGCTTPKDWPKDPIMPGDEGLIEVEFNSEGKSGLQSKSINIVSNTDPSTSVLYLEGEVVSPN
ncbi:MAG: hypothetical protein ACI8XB_001261 [Patiriisocius sp.]|jgi:hypothetical protein